MPSRILVVEDEPGLRLAISDRLRAEGYDVATAADGDEGCRSASEQHFDLVVLDVMLPGRSGLDVCRDLRRRQVGSAILMLTARGEVVDRVLGLKLGADDYLVKPFAMAELLARVEARLRDRAGASGPRDAYRFGDVHVDFRRAEVRRGGRAVEVSAKELQLLRYFVEHREAALTRDELLDGVWGQDAMPSTRTVDVHVAELRRKLEPDPHHPRYVLTVHRIGYKFVG